MLHHLALSVPRGVHQAHRGLVPVQLHLLQVDVGRVVEEGGDGHHPLHLLLLSDQQDVFQRGDLLLERDGLVHIVGVTDDDESGRLLELLLESVGVGEAVGGESDSSQFPDGEREEPVLHVVAAPEADHRALPHPQLGQAPDQSPHVSTSLTEGLAAARGLVLQPGPGGVLGGQAGQDQLGERLLRDLRLSLPGRELAVASG